jgi:hypothetical protein
MKRIKAYSIIELIVVMLISSIVIATAYQGYLLFFRQYLGFSERSAKIARVSLVDRLLLSDFENSFDVRKQGYCIYCRYPSHLVRYEFFSGGIIRLQDAVRDTFFMKMQHPQVTFRNLTANEGSLVDRISFSIEREKDSINFSYEKKYGADVLMNENKKRLQ